MALILGLDIATVTGFAWYDDKASLSSIRTGLIKAVGDNAEEKAADLALSLLAILKAEKPDFVAIEQPMRNVKSFTKEVDTLNGPEEISTINPNALQLEGLVCAAIAIVAAYRIPWGTIPSATWRKSYFGSGFKPPMKQIKQGKKQVWKKDWKRAAVDRAMSLRIDVKNADAAEAVGIAFAGAQTQGYKMLQARAA